MKLTKHVTLNENRIRKIAEVIRNLPDAKGLNFYSFDTPNGTVIADDMYPSRNNSHAIDFFFFAVLHQHGFWFGNHNGYKQPILGTLERKKGIKGSDLLWKVLKRALDKDPDIMSVERLASITPKEFACLFSDDDGPIPFPDWKRRYMLTHKYAEYLLHNKLTPTKIVQRADASKRSLSKFKTLMRRVPGFKDPFKKKTYLLAMIMAERPERFLTITDPESWEPIVDYHLMRLALRTGMVNVEDWKIRDHLSGRLWVSSITEALIRRATFDAVKMVMELSEKPMAFVDHAFWSGRKFCPEMTEPNCVECIFRDACGQHTELFQPVYRTLNY